MLLVLLYIHEYRLKMQIGDSRHPKSSGRDFIIYEFAATA